jgi:exodeoxyribonuclease-5
MELTPDQAAAADAIMAWLRGPGTVFALRGLAGTGKTSLLAVLHETLERPPVLTPTGRAAAVLRRKGVPATTIHAAIYQVLKTAEGVKWVLRKPPEERYPLAIVDEASMVNDTTLRDLCTIYTRVILVGDQGQLPPIEGRSPLAESRGFTLTTVLRQALDSGVIRTALALRGGRVNQRRTQGGSW